MMRPEGESFQASASHLSDLMAEGRDSVGWWAGDPEELIVQIKSEGSLLQIGKIKLVVGSSMVVFNLREGEILRNSRLRIKEKIRLKIKNNR